MRRAERLFRLVNEMQSHDVVRASDLAQSLEVSTSTIYRDLAHLQGSGLPIEGEPGLGYMLRKGTELPSVAFTHDQIDALAMGLAFVERSGDPDLAHAAREARAKIQASLPNPSDRILADAPYFRMGGSEPPPFITELRRAIRDCHYVDMRYKTGDISETDRRVRPLLVSSFPSGWMFSGWCHLREDFRTFRLDRITQMTVSQDRFGADPDKDLAAFRTREDCV